jgi:hypothetical protein
MENQKIIFKMGCGKLPTNKILWRSQGKSKGKIFDFKVGR